jgi:capsule biosynthesis phosphatase
MVNLLFIYYTLSKLPIEIVELNFIVAPHLLNYNFNEIIINLFPHIKCNFYNLPYSTRGAIESAYLGVKDLNLKGSIVFLDNDNLYTFPSNFYKSYNNSFIGFVENYTDSENYSFIKINNNQITEIKEKKKISNFICCGVYGFKDIDEFKKYAYKILTNNCYLNEFYLSMIYEEMINNGYIIKPIKFDFVNHIGTYEDLINNHIDLPKMRICFDLDNTIVTYPCIPGDYTTVKPIYTIINLIKKLKNDGHTIIIHTARRMKTHNHNQGAVLADIGEITFKTLREFEIPFDEIIFGKPIADIYIDDRSINPYKNEMKLLGIMDFKEIKIPKNKISNNKYNSIELENGIIKKQD